MYPINNKTTVATPMNRRNFLKTTVAAGAALTVGYSASGMLTTASAATAETTAFSPYVRVNADGTVNMRLLIMSFTRTWPSVRKVPAAQPLWQIPSCNTAPQAPLPEVA